ncbi:hypothetical protein [Parasphingopyxis sp.]|uniref:hypothetical protein n=1 Tax=Parasphingopyxis sp. TaxID=1920299 RepID=UPI00260CE8FC|nr:hypothetical protein [Parasphingopyxis sp.]
MGHEAVLNPHIDAIPVGEAERELFHRLRANAHKMNNRQCVALAKLAVEDEATVVDWRRGDSILSRRMPVGTPIATFMDREGRDSDYYDGAVGIGAPGNMTSHAAVLIGYVSGALGVPDGILVLDQHALLPGMRRMVYPIDDTLFGTASANNYYAINGLDDRPLGGLANPYWKLQQLNTIPVVKESASLTTTSLLEIDLTAGNQSKLELVGNP